MSGTTEAFARVRIDALLQGAGCVEALSAEVSRGRCNLLVGMATGTGKTRTAAAFVKRLFEAGIVTRMLFLLRGGGRPRPIRARGNRPPASGGGDRT